MKSNHRYKDIEIAQVVTRLAAYLRLQITDAEIVATFADFSLPSPSREVSRRIRQLVEAELNRKMQMLCDLFSRKFESEPKPRDLIVALEASGHTSSRPFRTALMEMLRAKNSTLWVPAASLRKRTVRLSAGEDAMWEALQRTYHMNSDATASLLLRIFVAVTSTGKVPFLDVPFVASALSDSALKRYADSLNFSVKKTRKSRV